MINDTVSVELSGAEGTIYIVFGIYWSTSFGQSGFPSLVILFRPMLRFCAISILERSYRLGRTSTGGGGACNDRHWYIFGIHPGHQKILSSLICGWKGP